MSDNGEIWTEENLEKNIIDESIKGLTWDSIKALAEDLKPVEKFDFELMPEALRPWIKDVSYRMQCPPDYPAVTAMVALSSLIGRKVGIKPKQKDNWTVVPNLWGVVVGRPSEKKTPTMNEALKPIEKLEIKEKKLFIKGEENFKIQNDLFEIQKKGLKEKAKAAVKDENIGEANKYLSEANKNPPFLQPRKRYIVNDATVEKLGELLNENPNGLLLKRDELKGWLKSLNKYENSSDRQFYLEAFNGNGRYAYDRIGRGTVEIEATIISIIGGIQPSALLPYIRDSIQGGSNDDGLIQRLQLAVYPDPIPFEYVDEHPNKNAIGRAYTLFERIDSMEPRQSEDKYSDIGCLRFDPEAQEVFRLWLIALESELVSDSFHPALEAHFAKYPGLIPSLALVLELADNPNAEDISKQSIIRACAWGEYLKSHAERIYSLAINNEVRNAKTILEKIKKGKLKVPFEIRDAVRPQWSGITTKEEVHSAIDILLCEGYLQTINIEGAGRPKTLYCAHPDIERGSNE